MAQSRKKDGKNRTVGFERLVDSRKEYQAAKFEVFFLGQDVITASDGGENGWGIKWDWETDDIWGEKL